MKQQFPGFIDIHVHLRDPGSTQKEDFLTGSKAAVKGGFTYILDMPNNPTPTFSPEALQDKIERSKKVAICDIGFHYGTDGTNLSTFEQVWDNPSVFGLKIYCNETTGKYMVSSQETLDAIFNAWESSKPILVHAEGSMLPIVLSLAKKYSRFIHVCHVSTQEDVEIIRSSKLTYKNITAGVCPHHLYLTMKDEALLGNFALMKPPLGSAQDQMALWQALKDGTIDLIESDHAPHTKEEKKSETPTYGVPGLESTLGLLMRSVDEGKLSQDEVKKFIYDNPKRIFSIPEQSDTYIECDPNEPFKIGMGGYESKCGWSPFEGWDVYGKIMKVVIHGKVVYEEGSFR